MREKITIGNAFEGESYAGKTSAIESMVEMDEVKDRGIVVVPEYSVMGPLPEFHRKTGADIRKTISRMIDLEKKRTDRLSTDLEKQGSGLVVFDRGPISCIAFEYAAEKNGYTGAVLWLAVNTDYMKDSKTGEVVKEMINPGIALIKLCKQKNIPLVLGSDAHRPQKIASNFPATMDLLNNLEIHNLFYLQGRKLQEYSIV